jgi:WD40 repeat protein
MRVVLVSLLVAVVAVGASGGVPSSPPPLTDGKSDGAAEGRGRPALPPRAVARLGATAFRHGSAITALAVAPDGKLAATMTDSPLGRHLHFWDVATGKLLSRLECDDFGTPVPRVMAFSPDGKILASVQYGGVRLWAAPSGKLLREFSAKVRHSGACLAFSWDGKVVASGGADWPNPPLSDEERHALIRTGNKELRKRYEASQKIESAVHFWEVATGKELRRLPAGDHHGVTCLAFLAGDKAVLTGNVDQALCLWEVVSGGLRYERVLRKGVSGSMSFTLSPDRKTLLTTAARPSGREEDHVLLEAATGREIKRFPTPDGVTASLAFTPACRGVAAVEAAGAVRLLDVLTGKELRLFDRPADFWVDHILPDGKRTLSSHGNFLRVWDTVTGRELFPRVGHLERLRAVAFLPDGRTVASVSYGGFILSDAASGRELRRTAGDNTPRGPASVALAPEGGALAMAGSGYFDPRPSPPGVIRVWDTRTGKERHRLKEDESWRVLAVSPDGKTVATAPGYFGDELAFRLRDAATGKVLLAVRVPEDDWEENRRRRNVRMPQGITSRLAFSAGGRTLVTTGRTHQGGKQWLRVWDATTGRLRWAEPTINDGILAFSPDGRMLAVPGPDETVRVLEAPTGKERVVLQRGEPWVTALAFSPDGTRLVSGELDGSARIWDLATGKELRRLRGHGGAVDCLAFSPDGRRLATGSDDATVLTWDVSELAARR